MSYADPDIVGDMICVVPIKGTDTTKRTIKYAVRFRRGKTIYYGGYTKTTMHKCFGVSKCKDILASWQKSKEVNSAQLLRSEEKVKTLTQRLREVKEKQKATAQNAKTIQDRLKEAVEMAHDTEQDREKISQQLAEMDGECQGLGAETSALGEKIETLEMEKAEMEKAHVATLGERGTAIQRAAAEIVDLKYRISELSAGNNSAVTKNRAEFEEAVKNFNFVLGNMENKWAADAKMLEESTAMARSWVSYLPAMRKTTTNLLNNRPNGEIGEETEHVVAHGHITGIDGTPYAIM